MGRREDREFDRLRSQYASGPPVNVLEQEHGVLQSEKIQRLSDHSVETPLICPFTEDNLRSAGYKLSVGARYKHVVDGERQAVVDLSDYDSIVIQPYGVVVIETEETLCLPRNMIGRWNIAVGLAYKGLVWVGAAQVDPGWTGRLFAPIYNLSDKQICLNRGEHFATIDFVLTTGYTERESKAYESPKKGHVSLEFYNVPSTGLGNLRGRMEDSLDELGEVKRELSERMRHVERQAGFLTMLTLTLLTLIITAASITVAQGKGRFSWDEVEWVHTFLVMAALLLFGAGGFISLIVPKGKNG